MCIKRADPAAQKRLRERNARLRRHTSFDHYAPRAETDLRKLPNPRASFGLGSGFIPNTHESYIGERFEAVAGPSQVPPDRRFFYLLGGKSKIHARSDSRLREKINIRLNTVNVITRYQPMTALVVLNPIYLSYTFSGMYPSRTQTATPPYISRKFRMSRFSFEGTRRISERFYIRAFF